MTRPIAPRGEQRYAIHERRNCVRSLLKVFPRELDFDGIITARISARFAILRHRGGWRGSLHGWPARRLAYRNILVDYDWPGRHW